MTTLHERIGTALPPEEVFDYVADFQSAAEWDPGVAYARRLDDGPIGPGTRYELGVRMGRRVVPMTYRITVFERPTRVVLEGAGSNVEAVDDIRFRPRAGGTVVDYTADIHLRGGLRLIRPFVGGTLVKIGRDAAAGMTRSLRLRVASSSAEAAD